MWVLLSDLQRKDIININNGKRVGRIIDAEIDESNGHLKKLIIEPNRYFRSVFNEGKDLRIKYEQIKKMGEDVILIDLT